MAAVCAGALAASVAASQNLISARYDAKTDELVVDVAYQGTNPDHRFSLRWDECKPLSRPRAPHQIAALVEDSQWDDKAREDFRKTVRFSLQQMPCRPAVVTLHTAAGFEQTLHVPAAPEAER